MDWITENAGTIIVSILLCVILFMATKKVVVDMKNGGGCSCGCGNCAMSDKCHKKKDTNGE